MEIHVGAPTPNVEHACLKPSFDLEVPYLLATLIPTDMGIYISNLYFETLLDESLIESFVLYKRKYFSTRVISIEIFCNYHCYRLERTFNLY